MAIGQNYTMTIERMGQSGDGVGRIPDGRLAFIPGALPGEVVRVEVTEERRNFVRARILEMVHESRERIQPVCPIFGLCGGCTFQHWQYSAELAYKENRVREALRQQGMDPLAVQPIRGAESPYGYRNKGQFPFAGTPGQVAIGLYQRNSHRVIPAAHCDIQDDLVNDVLSQAAGIANQVGLSPYDEGTHQGILRHLLIRSSRQENRVLVLIVARAEHSALLSFAERLQERIPSVVGVGANINPSRGNRVLGDITRLLSGESYIIETILGASFRLSFTSFFQVNPVQAAVLYDAALGFLPAQCGEVWDLYSGVGTLATLAAFRARKVRAVESNREAVKDAKINFSMNSRRNVMIEAGRVEDLAHAWVKEKKTPPDAVIVDPPRAGLDGRAIEAILRLRPRQLIYVSCNPETWARDITLMESRYSLARAIPVDMFPRTDHVEVASLLTER